MSQWMSATFLGTSSGGGPTDSRNCSSLVLDVVGDGSLWMIDGAEGTLRQFSLQPPKNAGKTLKVSQVSKIFVTHMHADHVMGLPTLLRNILGFPHPEDISPRGTPPRVNLYGPAGLRSFVRATLSLTRTKTADRYAVHELLTPTDPRTPCEVEALHDHEEPGRDLLCDEDGYWRNFTDGRSFRGAVNVCAGPLIHREPCIGFIIHEPASLPAPRKLVILGDTSSAVGLTALVSSTPGRVSLLVHEATDAHMPEGIDPRFAARGPPAVIAAKAKERGHSTPPEAGACAAKWGAKKLILNHIGTRFPAPFLGSSSGKRVTIIREMERQASEAWRSTPCELPVELGAEVAMVANVADEDECNAVAAFDFLTVQIPTADGNSRNNQGGRTGGQASGRQPSRGHAAKRKRGPRSDDTR